MGVRPRRRRRAPDNRDTAAARRSGRRWRSSPHCRCRAPGPGCAGSRQAPSGGGAARRWPPPRRPPPAAAGRCARAPARRERGGCRLSPPDRTRRGRPRARSSSPSESSRSLYSRAVFSPAKEKSRLSAKARAARRDLPARGHAASPGTRTHAGRRPRPAARAPGRPDSRAPAAARPCRTPRRRRRRACARAPRSRRRSVTWASSVCPPLAIRHRNGGSNGSSVGEEVRGDVALQMVDGRERQLARGGERLRGRQPDEQRADQARALGGGDEVDLIQRRRRLRERLCRRSRRRARGGGARRSPGRRRRSARARPARRSRSRAPARRRRSPPRTCRRSSSRAPGSSCRAGVGHVLERAGAASPACATSRARPRRCPGSSGGACPAARKPSRS